MQSLTARYREAANRELKLGRYRRAAYIFADLLGDFSAAASALEQGRFFREAAVIFRDHLMQRAKAAECLERGGLLSEAIALYEELSMFEKAGDLYARMDRVEDAARCYRKQVEACVARHDLLAAAQVLEGKLNLPDEAIKLFLDSWPRADAAGIYLRALFQLLGRHARHEEAIQCVRRLHDDPAELSRGITAALALSDVATSYPQDGVRAVCADTMRILAGRHLQHAEGETRVKLARALVPLAPSDRMLARDVERFLKVPTRRNVAGPIRRNGKNPVVVRRFTLRGLLPWQAVVADGDEFYAITSPAAGQSRVVRGRWDGVLREFPMPVVGIVPEETAWTLHPQPGRSRITAMPGIGPVWSIFLRPCDALPVQAQVGIPEWLNMQGLRTITHTDKGITWALHDQYLKFYRTDTGDLIETQSLDITIPPDLRVYLVVRSDIAYMAWGSTLLLFSRMHGTQLNSSPGEVRQLIDTSLPSGAAVIAALQDGALRLGPDGSQSLFADGLAEPIVASTRGGMLVAANATEGRIYQADADTCRCVGTFAGIGTGPLAVSGTDKLNEFATFTSDGTVTVYQIPD